MVLEAHSQVRLCGWQMEDEDAAISVVKAGEAVPDGGDDEDGDGGGGDDDDDDGGSSRTAGTVNLDSRLTIEVGSVQGCSGVCSMCCVCAGGPS